MAHRSLCNVHQTLPFHETQLQVSIQPWICTPGTHYCWVTRGNVDSNLTKCIWPARRESNPRHIDLKSHALTARPHAQICVICMNIYIRTSPVFGIVPVQIRTNADGSLIWLHVFPPHPSLQREENEWCLGHDSALVRLYWAGNNRAFW